jgi:hypothetical protein
MVVVSLKPRPNHRRYISILRRMTADQRAQKMFELSQFTKQLFLDGLRNRHRELSESQFHDLAQRRLAKCHNRN